MSSFNPSNNNTNVPLNTDHHHHSSSNAAASYGDADALMMISSWDPHLDAITDLESFMVFQEETMSLQQLSDQCTDYAAIPANLGAGSFNISNPNTIGTHHLPDDASNIVHVARSRTSDDRQIISIHVPTEDIRVSDGYVWRKYGEKSIKNKMFPRSYFKCAKNGCSITKQAERCSEHGDCSIMTYIGKHNHHPEHS